MSSFGFKIRLYRNIPSTTILNTYLINFINNYTFMKYFQNCLGIIYTVYVENVETPIETLVGNMLGCVQVPQPGGPQVRFSIGAGDRQALQPPLSQTLPVTKNAVYLLFQELGNLMFCFELLLIYIIL
jgi:hypothetical protein